MAQLRLARLHLRRFRSARDAAIEFDNPLFLVGRNGSGKSNIVDALAFLADCMAMPLQAAVETRGGAARVMRVDTDAARFDQEGLRMGLRADFVAAGSGAVRGYYAIEAQVARDQTVQVVREQGRLRGGREATWFDRRGGRFESNVSGISPALSAGALALPIVGGLDQFAPMLDTVSSMRVYALNPDRMRHSSIEGGRRLNPDGSNLAGVLTRLSRRGDRLNRVTELLRAVMPDLKSVSVETLLTTDHKVGRTLVMFAQESNGGGTVQFDASAMSDGTLRALGLIAAAMQEPAPSVMVFEEPELTLHPGALSLIAGLIQQAASRSSVIVTTHSPELLDAKWIKPSNIRLVEWRDHATQISALGEGAVTALQQHLMRPGELLRASALDAMDAPHKSDRPLFEPVPA